MCKHWNRVLVGGLLLLVGGVAGVLIDRYALAPYQPAAPPPATHPTDLDQLSAKWAYPGSKIVNAGRSGPIAYSVSITPDDVVRVAAHYQPLVGRALLPIEGTSGGGGGSSTEASVSVVDSWASGSPGQPQRLVLAARTEAGYSATVVLYRGADDELTRVAVTLSER